ncbi:MAG: hypothetical protein AAF532_02265 [Planctomycetota bacterium]
MSGVSRLLRQSTSQSVICSPPLVQLDGTSYTGAVTATPHVKRRIDASTVAANDDSTGVAIASRGQFHEIQFNSTVTAFVDEVVVLLQEPGCIPVTWPFRVIPAAEYDARVLGRTTLNAAQGGQLARVADVGVPGTVAAGPAPTASGFAGDGLPGTLSPVGQYLVFTGGTLVSQARLITGVNAGLFAFDEPFSAAPSAADEFEILGRGV